jgi:hypothetical protein
MNPWLRELVRTMAAVAVEDVLAREGGRDAPSSAAEPLRAPSGRDCATEPLQGMPAETVPDLGAVGQRR